MSSQLNLPHGTKQKRIMKKVKTKLEMWANAQRDGRPAEYRWCLCSTPQSLANTQYYSAVQ